MYLGPGSYLMRGVNNQSKEARRVRALAEQLATDAGAALSEADKRLIGAAAANLTTIEKLQAAALTGGVVDLSGLASLSTATAEMLARLPRRGGIAA